MPPLQTSFAFFKSLSKLLLMSACPAYATEANATKTTAVRNTLYEGVYGSRDSLDGFNGIISSSTSAFEVLYASLTFSFLIYVELLESVLHTPL